MYTLQPNLSRDKGGTKIPQQSQGGHPPPDAHGSTSEPGPERRPPSDGDDLPVRPASRRAELLGTLLLVLGPFLLFLAIAFLDRLTH